MPKTNQGASLKLKVTTITLGLLALGLIIVICFPTTRASLRSYITYPEREVLSVVQGNLLHNGQFVKVIKYKTLDGILLEVLGSDESGSRSLIDTILIPGEKNGYFDFYGEASQLAILDADEDGLVELVAPTFDSHLVPHLNIYKYNPTSERFEALQAPSK